MSNTDKIVGKGAYQQALRKARFGHRAWVSYRERDGTPVAERLTSESMKRCLLSTGTQGNWTLIDTDGTSTTGFWWLGCNVINQFKRGLR